jgi:hypothetical protein
VNDEADFKLLLRMRFALDFEMELFLEDNPGAGSSGSSEGATGSSFCWLGGGALVETVGDGGGVEGSKEPARETFLIEGARWETIEPFRDLRPCEPRDVRELVEPTAQLSSSSSLGSLAWSCDCECMSWAERMIEAFVLRCETRWAWLLALGWVL